MITNYKIFENDNYIRYKIGDYILLSTIDLHSTLRNYNMYKNYGKIVGTQSSTASDMYDTQYIDNETCKISEMTEYVLEKNIVRKLTKDEIEDFELTLNINKYNL